MASVSEACCYYLALLRSLYLTHQNNHWLSKGDNFYGNHLLFQRIYESAQVNSDLAAEKFIGVFGSECVSLKDQSEYIYKITKNLDDKDPVKLSLSLEKTFLDFSKEFYGQLKAKDLMTLGLDDMIMSIASDREEAVYLLQQAGGVSPKVADVANKFIKKFSQPQPDQVIKLDTKKLKTACEAAIANLNYGVPFRVDIEFNQLDGKVKGTLRLPAKKPGSSQYLINDSKLSHAVDVGLKALQEAVKRQIKDLPTNFVITFGAAPL